MKKITAIMIAALLCAIAQAATWKAFDMADYGTTASITNNSGVVTEVITDALVTYDAATTNTLTVYIVKGGISYQIGTASVSNEQYDAVTVTDVTYAPGDVLKITTTDTNVNVLVRSE